MKIEDKALKIIGEKLKKLREEAGYTSYETFASDNDLSRMHYWTIEKGKINITIKTLVKILNIHKLTIDEFFKDKQPLK